MKKVKFEEVNGDIIVCFLDDLPKYLISKEESDIWVVADTALNRLCQHETKDEAREYLDSLVQMQ